MSVILSTVDNKLISLGALNADDSEAIESMLLHGFTKVFNRWSPLNEHSAEHDVAGMTAKIDATFKISGITS